MNCCLRQVPIRLAYAVGACLLGIGTATGAAAEIDAQRVTALVQQLNADDAGDRDAAERELTELGRGDADALLAALPSPDQRMPPEVAMRLDRIRAAVQQDVAESALSASRLTLDMQDAKLADIFAAIEKQTGNRLIDFREQFGQQPADVPLTVTADDAEFWPVVDRLLDDANLSPYPYSGEDGLGIVERPPEELRRSGRATYVGPLRLEPIAVQAQRGLRSPEQSNLHVGLEASWEPRLEPIALSLDAASLQVTADDGRSIPLATQMNVIDVELQPGSFASDLTLPLELPAREATMLSTIAGTLTVLAPGKKAEFKFDKLKDAEGVEQTIAGVTVAVDRVRKNGPVWEVYMRVRVAGPETGLESHRSWVYQNLAWLVNPAGEKVEDVGIETVSQGVDEIGFAYIYEIPEDDIAGYQWIYQSPAAIMSVPLEFELHDIPLP